MRRVLRRTPEVNGALTGQLDAAGLRVGRRVRAVWLGAGVGVVALVAASAFVFAPVLGFDFVSWDDPGYIIKNPHVAAGLTWQSVKWAFWASGGYYWHPLTWLSHMLDVQLFGFEPGFHHLTSVALHALAALLLFGFWRVATGAEWRSLAVAMLFAIHPLHVESVAWVAERKDVLSAVFWTCTLWAYLWYARQPRRGRYLLVIGCYALGLMAKPMVVTLPIVLLLLDVWPLGRLEGGGSPRPARWWQLVYEKLPLLALATASAVVTVVGQGDAGALRSVSTFPLWLRLANALVSPVIYLEKTFWPSGLAAFYPYPLSFPVWQVVGAAALIAGLTVGAWRARTTRPHLFVGWFWYLATLLPVIGLVQVGDQSRADRFTYLPLVGIFVVVVWEAASLRCRWKGGTLAFAMATVLVFGGTAVAARQQVHTWKDSHTLWSRAVKVTSDNERAHINLAEVLRSQGRAQEALPHYREAARLLKAEAGAAHVRATAAANLHNTTGRLLMEMGRPAEAVLEFSTAAGLVAEDADFRHNLGVALDALGRNDEAAAQYREVARLRPADARSQMNACLAEANLGRLGHAIPLCLEALRLEPRHPNWHYAVALMLMDSGAPAEAAAHLRAALALDPAMSEARRRLDQLRLP